MIESATDLRVGDRIWFAGDWREITGIRDTGRQGGLLLSLRGWDAPPCAMRPHWKVEARRA